MHSATNVHVGDYAEAICAPRCNFIQLKCLTISCLAKMRRIPVQKCTCNMAFWLVTLVSIFSCDQLLCVFKQLYEIWPCTFWAILKQCDHIERLQNRALCIISRCRYAIYNDVLSELNVTSLWQIRHNLLHSFGEKLLNSDKFRNLLPRSNTAQEFLDPTLEPQTFL